MHNDFPAMLDRWPGPSASGGAERRKRLGDYLKRRRAAIGPEAFGLPVRRRRRAPGLRREEIALLAGISVTWYSQLESGAEITVSLALLARICDVLRLGPLERAYVFALGIEELAVMRTALPELDFASGARISADRFEDEIALVLRAHRSIKTQLYGATLHGTLPQLHDCLDETRCPIGLWLHDDLAPARRASAGYREAARAHSAFHIEIDRVVTEGAVESAARAERLLAASAPYGLASASLEHAFAAWVRAAGA